MGGIQLFKDKVSDEKMGLLLIANLFVTVIILVLTILNLKRQLFISEGEGLSFDASKRDFCSLVTTQLIEKKLSDKIITESLYGLVTKENYKALYFEGDEKISGTWSEENSCKVLIKTKDGLRSFDYFFDQGKDFKFYYQIKKITENELYEKESK